MHRLSHRIPVVACAFAVLAGLAATIRAADVDVYDAVLAELGELEKAVPEIELSYYGSSAAGRRLPFVVVNRDRQFTAKRLARTGRPLVLVLGGVHGDEPVGAEVVLRFLRDLHSGEHRALVDAANYLLVPALDVDGLPDRGTSGRHTTPAGLDLDRDWLKLEAEETRSLVTIVAGWKPHLVIDVHGDHGADLAGRDGAVLRRPAAALAGATAAAWLDQALGEGVEEVADPRPGSSLGYFSLRRRPVVRIDAPAPEAAYAAVLDVLAAVADEPGAVKSAAAGEPLPAVAGYLVPPGWQRIERALRDHGILGERLPEPQKLTAERLVLAEPRFAERPDQGLFRVACRVRSETGPRILPAGSLWIPADQPLGAVVRELLEPAAAESLVSWGLISSVFTGEGTDVEAPILRAAKRPAGETRPWS